MKTALICGVTGQDGSYLAQFLLGKNYSVWGTSRDAQVANLNNLKILGIQDRINFISMASNDFRSVLNTLVRAEPDEIYFLAGQTSVGLSFEQPVETIESITLSILNILEALRFIGKPIKLYHASSSECFGDLGRVSTTEEMPFRPRSPYAVAKASAHWLVANYREAYGLFACNGILFNHESPLRPERFVTSKIVNAAIRIMNGSKEHLLLGRLDVVRDWGWAPEYVDAMWRMIQQEKPDDYIIATGQANSLEEFVAETFSNIGLDWRQHVQVNEKLYRPSDLSWSAGNPEKAKRILNWQANHRMADVVKMLIKARRTGDASC